MGIRTIPAYPNLEFSPQMANCPASFGERECAHTSTSGEHGPGERHAEHLVRVEDADGNVGHLEGEQGAEQVVRFELSNGPK